MTTLDPDFSSAVHRKSNMIIGHGLLLEMHKYKLSLIDLMIYEPSKSKTGLPNKPKTDMILDEIKRVEAWSKKHWEIFLHDKNRRMSA